MYVAVQWLDFLFLQLHMTEKLFNFKPLFIKMLMINLPIRGGSRDGSSQHFLKLSRVEPDHDRAESSRAKQKAYLESY